MNNSQSVAAVRLAIGLGQGVALYLLYLSYDAKVWPSTDGLVFAPLVTVAGFVPLVLVAGIADMRSRTLVVWTLLAVLFCAGLAFYDLYRAVDFGDFGVTGDERGRLAPSPYVLASLIGGLFIAHVLIAAGDAERKPIAGYSRYFDLAWKYGVQLVLAAGFVALFWGVLVLGNGLFRLIKIEFLWDLIRKPLFAIPATAISLSYALHVTDVHDGIVRGARMLGLSLLSWLLPLMTLFVVAFLAALPFTGLEPLWSTRHATVVLLLAAAALIVLLNAAYQDGQPETAIARVLRYAGSVTAMTIAPLVAIAAYALWLRVDQYGWTSDRVMAAACVGIAACYALGYGIAAVMPGAWLKWIERTNIVAAFVILAALLALLTPLADPARISVADQMARLEQGRVPPDKFDFAFLRFDGGRYGRAALERLEAKTGGPEAVRIAQRATEALAWKTRPYARDQMPATPQDRALAIAVLHPKGQALPDSFVQQKWPGRYEAWQVPTCLTSSIPTAKCEALIDDLDGDGVAEIVLLAAPTGAAVVFKIGADGVWSRAGALMNGHCSGVRDALRAGAPEISQPPFKDIVIAGQRLNVQADCVPRPRGEPK